MNNVLLELSLPTWCACASLGCGKHQLFLHLCLVTRTKKIPNFLQHQYAALMWCLVTCIVFNIYVMMCVCVRVCVCVCVCVLIEGEEI